MHRPIEQRILAMQHRFLQRPLADIMPTPGLCRVGVPNSVGAKDL
jgi:hypothetical protein